jgi:hypothetical protein
MPLHGRQQDPVHYFKFSFFNFFFVFFMPLHGRQQDPVHYLNSFNLFVYLFYLLSSCVYTATAGPSTLFYFLFIFLFILLFVCLFVCFDYPLHGFSQVLNIYNVYLLYIVNVRGHYFSKVLYIFASYCRLLGY